MNLKCSNCGALLAPSQQQDGIVRCQFCGGEQILTSQPAPAPPPAPATPPRVAPALATERPLPPPEDAPAPPDTVPNTGSSAVARIVVILVVFAALAGGIAYFVTSGTAAFGFPTAQLATFSLQQTPEALAKITAIPADAELRMRVPLSGGPYESITFSWDKKDVSHVKDVLFYAKGPTPDRAAHLQKLRSYLGRRIDANGSFYYDDARITLNDSSLLFGVSLNDDPVISHVHWKEQMDALWDVTRAAVFGQNVAVSPTALRDWLGGGYPLTALGSIDFATDVDHSTAVMQKAFPGVDTRAIGDLEHTVQLDHPWFGYVKLSWQNKAGGKFHEALFYRPIGTPEGQNMDAMVACTQVGMGSSGTRSDEDHLKGTYDVSFAGGHGIGARVYPGMIDVYVSTDDPPWPGEHDAWVKLVTALDACGRAK